MSEGNPVVEVGANEPQKPDPKTGLLPDETALVDELMEEPAKIAGWVKRALIEQAVRANRMTQDPDPSKAKAAAEMFQRSAAEAISAFRRGEKHAKGS